MPLLRPPEVTPRAVRGSDEPVTVWCVVSRRTGQSASRLFAQKATEYSLVGYGIGTCRRTGAPLHRHGNAWNFCAFGAKRWFLLPERRQHTNKPPAHASQSRLSVANACRHSDGSVRPLPLVRINGPSSTFAADAVLCCLHWSCRMCMRTAPRWAR
jgi:hypothetical protein